uniref:Uncharacterized protein n=1 Tax=Oryza meridionalis TaxID=40149 RepID=A0A0E0EQP6_9ORYZ
MWAPLLSGRQRISNTFGSGGFSGNRIHQQIVLRMCLGHGVFPATHICAANHAPGHSDGSGCSTTRDI